MSKKVWIIIAIIVALLIVIFLFMRNKKKKEEAARQAELQAAANSTQGTGTLAEALSGLIPVIMQNVGKDKTVTVVPDLNATSNMGTGSTTKSMLGVFGGTTRGITDAKVIVTPLDNKGAIAWNYRCKDEFGNTVYSMYPCAGTK